MAVRLQGAKRHAAERGELRLPLPAGYLYDSEGNWVIDPDQEVQAAIADLFKAFHQAGSAYGVVGIFQGRRFPTRAYGSGWAGELRWGALTYARVLDVLYKPLLRGHLRVRALPLPPAALVRPDGTIVTKRDRLPRSEWSVVIQDHHPGY